MDITNTVSKLRSDPLLLGDYSAYRATCSRRITKLRKRLGRTSTTAKSKKYTPKPPIIPEDIANDSRIAQLLIYSAERAWAHAMLMKSASADAGNPAPIGSTRSHIISRLEKSHRHAAQLVALLDDPTSKATQADHLEALAYAESLAGAISFEKKAWETMLTQLSTSRVIYASLLVKFKSDVYKEVLSTNIDPNVRYSAYQLKLSRSQDLASITRQHFPKSDSKLVTSVTELDPKALTEEEDAVMEDGASGLATTVNSVTWRGRTAPVTNVDVALSLTNVQSAETSLQTYLDSHTATPGRDQAAQFDEILAAWQESVDVTKKAIDDAVAEGLSAGDEQLQALQLTYTYVNYNLISWRIRRNRTMARGLVSGKLEGTRKLSGMKEEVALWDAILQSLEQVLDLPGVAADEEFGQEIEGRRLYFLALKCSAIAESHSLLGNRLNALALYNQASNYINQSTPLLASSTSTTTGMDISSAEASALQTTLTASVIRYHALAEMDRLTAKSAKAKGSGKPHIERLDEYPEHGVDFANLVSYPPRVEAIPVKPIFFDIAFNFIEYPGREKELLQETTASGNGPEKAGEKQAQSPEQKKGLFGGFWGRN